MRSQELVLVEHVARVEVDGLQVRQRVAVQGPLHDVRLG